MKGFKRLHINKSHLIRQFDNENADLYNYHDDFSTNSGRQRTMCKQMPLKPNMASVLTDARVNEMYCEFLSDFVNYVSNTQNEAVYDDNQIDYDKADICVDKMKNGEKANINQIEGR